MPPTLTFSSKAYLKLYFHAAKHPHRSINGVFVGKQGSTGSPIEVEDAIPLLHHWTSLSPMMEIGLDLASQYATESGLKVIGYYQARASLGESGGLGSVGELIAQRIKEKFPDAFAATIDPDDFGTDKPALNIWTRSESQWKRVAQPEPFSQSSQIRLASPDLPSKVRSYVKDKSLHLQFGDFDDHLEDVSIDWIHNRACIPTE